MMESFLHSRFSWLARLVLLTCAATALWGQVTNATLSGTVTDNSGAVVPNARITVIHLGTQVSRSADADTTGTYTLVALRPGEYRVEATMQGFDKTVIQRIVLQVAQQTRLNIELKVGSVNETVNVEGVAPLLESESPVVGGVIEEDRVKTLPLKGRNFMELTTLTAGINEGTATNDKNFFNRGYAPAAAGAPSVENYYTLDGAKNQEGFFKSYGLAPSVDAVQEFKIQIGQYSAEFGAGGGAVINVVTKSGTNQFRGAAWEFIRNDNFDARNFFLPATEKIAPLAQNQYGVAAGGPIVKNRTFFFANWEGTKIRRGLFRSSVTPTATERRGDFNGFGKNILDPNGRTPFPNNTIPASRIDPISAKLVDYYPVPNTTNPIANYVVSPSSQTDLTSVLTRIDHLITSKHNLVFRYGVQDSGIYDPGNFPRVGGQNLPQRFQNGVLGLTSTFTPTLLSEFRFSYGRTTNLRQGQNRGNPIAADAGLPYGLRDDFNAGFPESIGMSQTRIRGLSEANPWFLTTNDFQWYEGITWIKGSHTIKTGADITRERANANIATHVNGNYTFGGLFSGDGFSDFLLGHPSSSLNALAANTPGDFRQTIFAAYVQDDWKVTPRLTMNIGVRYQIAQVPWEIGGQTPLFDPSLGNGVGGLAFPQQNTTAAGWYAANRPDLPVSKLDRRGLYRTDANNIAPRFGLSWRPTGGTSTVIRAGYGWFYSSTALMNRVQNSQTGPPGQLWPTYNSNITTPTLNWVGLVGVSPDQALRTATFGLLTGPEGQWLDGYTQQWSLSVARTVGKSMVLEGQYLGSASTHLPSGWDYNFTTPSAATLQPRLPYNKWGRIRGWNSGGSANYHALMLTAEKRLASGVAFKTAYTFGKAMGSGGARERGGDFPHVQDPGNARLERSVTGDNVAHRFVSTFLYELPVGKGKLVGSGMNSFWNRIVGGWSFAGVTTIRSGFWTNAAIAAANCNSATTQDCRPDLLANPELGGNGVATPKYDVKAFDWPRNPAHAVQTPRYGTAGSNIFQGNGVINFDLSLLKHIPVNDRMRFEFRWETFNSLNHANFSNPTSTVDNPTFGRTVSTQTDPRINQFGLKFYW
ncbi:MAG: carboxypeptidase regulatory-like domain-containing protein [Bryobacteraceae bacterium]